MPELKRAVGGFKVDNNQIQYKILEEGAQDIYLTPQGDLIQAAKNQGVNHPPREEEIFIWED